MTEDRFIGEHDEAADVTPTEGEGSEIETISVLGENDSEAKTEKLSPEELMAQMDDKIKYLQSQIEDSKKLQIKFQNAGSQAAAEEIGDNLKSMEADLDKMKEELSKAEKKNGYNVVREE